MSDYIQSADGHEFTLDRAVEDTPFARANLSRLTDQLRADVLDVVLPLAVPDSGTAWAIYQFDDGVQVEGGALAQIDKRQEALVMASADGRVQPTDPGQIRIVTKELERSSALPAFLMSEMTILQNGRTLCFFDAVTYRAPSVIQDTLASFFEISAKGELEFSSKFDMTPMVSVPYSSDQQQRIVYPFGKQDCLTDRMYALERAQSVVRCLKKLEPMAFGLKPE